jgi:hypothetical protein
MNDLSKSPSIAKEIEDPLKSIYDHLGDKFEAKVLTLASKFQHDEEYQDMTSDESINFEPVQMKKKNSLEHSKDTEDNPVSHKSHEETDHTLKIPYAISRKHKLTIHIDLEEVKEWISGYTSDPYFSKIINHLCSEINWQNPRYPQFFLGDNGLLFFKDWEGNN